MLQDGKKDLAPERYDSKLFQQAYRAGIRAKELDKQKAKKDKVNKYILYACLVVFSLSSIFLLKPEPKKQYISSLQNGSSQIILALPTVNEYPVKGLLDFNISAEAVLAYSVEESNVYYEKNSKEELNIASLTKLVTAMVLIDTYGLDTDIEILKEVPDDFGWSLGISQGDVINTEEILKAMLISSYNDAAYVIANEYGYEEYLKLMNEKASLLGCSNTHFINPMGLDHEDHYSTTEDLRKIVGAVLRYPSILEIADRLGSEIIWISDGEIKKEYIYTTNQLLGKNPYIKGLKTGYTEEAGQCLITLYENGLNKYVVILLGSEDRFAETKRILNALD